jgi:hypothetical protein
MNSNEYVRDYFLKNTSIKVSDALVNNDIVLEKEFLEDVISELFAINFDGDSSDSIGKGALLLSKIREKQPGFIEIAKNFGQEESLKKAAQEVYSGNYSDNVSINTYLDIMQVPSITKVLFSPNKSNHSISKTGSKLDFGRYHYYVLDRQDKLTLNMYFSKKEQVDGRDYANNIATRCFSILIDEDHDSRLMPSIGILSEVARLDKLWPYPSNTEYDFGFVHNARFGAAMARYLPDIRWSDAYLSKGRFDTSMWTLFLSELQNNSFLNEGVNLFSNLGSKGLQQIVQKFELPKGEFILEMNSTRDTKAANIIFNYFSECITPGAVKLEIEYARKYLKSDGLSNMDSEAF